MKNSVISLIAAALLSASLPALAQTCLKTPSCAELGYSKSTAECAGKTILKCPLDTSKVYCADTAATTETETECPSGYLKYAQIYPSCNEPNRAKLIEHSEQKGCYQCKKCMDGFWAENKCYAAMYTQKDSAGCIRCTECGYPKELMNGFCSK